MQSRFSICEKCGHPSLNVWGECAYCKGSVQVTAKQLVSGETWLYIFVLIVLFAWSTIAMFVMENGETMKNRKRDERSSSYSQPETRKSIEFDQNQLKRDLRNNELSPLVASYSYVVAHMNDPQEDLDKDKCFGDSVDILEKAIAENIRSVDKVVDWNDKVAILKGFPLFEGEMPSKGYIIYQEQGYGRNPFKINTDGGRGYVIKLVNRSNGKTVIEAFVPGNWEYEIEVPDGTCEMRYMQGDKWYGDRILFGNQCSCQKADKLFTFSNGHGYSVKLFKVRDGNLRTKYLRPEDF